MIRLVNVTTELGKAVLTFEYDVEGETRTATIEEREIIERLKVLRQLLGRKPTVQDLKEILVNIINEVRKQKEPFLGRFDYTKFIGVDLEQ